MGNSKSIHLCLNSFAKKQQVMRHCHFFFVSTDAKWKKCSPSYFSLLAQFFILPLYACMKNFRCEGGHSIAHLIFKTCVQRRKDHFRLFLNTHVVEKAKLLIKLIAVDSYLFIRYKCKITHCPDSQTLSEYISTIVLDDNEKLSINEVLDVLIVAGIFTSTSSFGTKSLQFVTMNELKKVCTRFVFFYFLLGSSTVSNFCWNSKLLYTRRCL